MERIHKLGMIALLLLPTIATAKLTDEQCNNFRDEYRIEPFSNKALETAIHLRNAIEIQQCVYPELKITNTYLGELENIEQWDNSGVGVTLTSRTHFQLGKYSAVTAILNPSKGYTVKTYKIGDESINQYRIVAFKEAAANK